MIERAFDILKNRFGILKVALQYSMLVQVAIVHACCNLHNFIRHDGGHQYDDEHANHGMLAMEHAYDSDVDDNDVIPVHAINVRSSQSFRSCSVREREEWRSFRNNFAQIKWNEYRINRI